MKLNSKKILILLLFVVFSCSSGENRENYIDVVGEAEEDIIPDSFELNFYVSSEDKTSPKEAHTQTIDFTKNIIKKLTEEFALQENDIKTRYSNYKKENYDNNLGKYIFESYVSENFITIKIDKKERINDITLFLLENNVSKVEAPNFIVNDYEKYYDDTLKKAISNAKQRANAVLGSDKKIGNILSFDVKNNDYKQDNKLEIKVFVRYYLK